MQLEVTLGGHEVNEAIEGLVRSKTGNANIEVSSWKAKKGNKSLVAICQTVENDDSDLEQTEL